MNQQQREFYTTCKLPFTPVYLHRGYADYHSPMEMSDIEIDDDALWGKRTLHYMIKKRDSDTLYIDSLLKEIPELETFIATCDMLMRFSFLSDLREGRYAYLTVDTGLVKAGETMRTPGWHIDCVQGDEVPEKNLET